jgi:hypothetical protein
LKWFTEDEARQTKLAYGFNEIIEQFYREAPFENNLPYLADF